MATRGDLQKFPLNEDFESYQIDIYDGSTIVRTTTVTSTTNYTYTEAAQISDFGSAQASIYWEIRQISAVYGPGTPGIGVL